MVPVPAWQTQPVQQSVFQQTVQPAQQPLSSWCLDFIRLFGAFLKHIFLFLGELPESEASVAAAGAAGAAAGAAGAAAGAAGAAAGTG